jgi:hypothetical protein
MAGGMTRKGTRLSLAERTSGKFRVGSQTAQPSRSGTAAGGRHCWVIDPPGAPGRWPGLLSEWRLGPTGWQGLVAYVVPTERGAVLMQEWVDAQRLEAGDVPSL